MISFLINIVRYLLAVVMIVYGWVKIIGVQFEIPDDIQNLSLKNLDGVTLAFAFLGYSKWLAVISGIVEFNGAILLLFRRTYLLRAVLLLPVLIYVFLVNIGYNFSMFMKVWTGSLIILDIILLTVNGTRLKNIFFDLLDDSQKNKPAIYEWVFNAIIVIVVIVALTLLIPTIK